MPRASEGKKEKVSIVVEEAMWVRGSLTSIDEMEL